MNEIGNETGQDSAAFADGLRTALRESERYDFVVESKLRAARARALDAARAPKRSWLLPAFTSALLALAAITSLWLLRPSGPADDNGDLAQAEALDVMTDELDPEFYENLDMYRWLSPPASAPAATGPSHV